MTPNPVLAVSYRNGVAESFHRGVICVVDTRGEVVYSVGDIQQLTFPRSALKYIQHLPLLESGAFNHFGFTDDELAIMCGSHNGEPEHLRVVSQILNKINLDISSLKCGAHPPFSPAEAERFFRRNETATALHNNCSGKHAGFLALCVYLGLDTSDYLKPTHPVQQMIRKTVAEMHEMDESLLVPALDGCSAPIYPMTVYQMAVGYKNLVSSSHGEARNAACKAIVKAVGENSFFVAGNQRFDTELMSVAGEKVIGKVGAEGVFNLAIPERKIGISIKVDDGKMQPQYNLAQWVLEQLNVLTTEEIVHLSNWKTSKIINHNGLLTGELRVVL